MKRKKSTLYLTTNKFLDYILVTVYSLIVYFFHILFVILLHPFFIFVGKWSDFVNSFFVYFGGDLVLFICFFLGGFTLVALRSYNIYIKVYFCLSSVLVTLLLSEIQIYDDSFILQLNKFVFYLSPFFGSIAGIFLASKFDRFGK